MAYHKSRKAQSSYTSKKNKHSKSSHSGSGRSAGGRSRQSRPIKTFDPSLFIKKVSEQVPAEVYVPKHTFADFSINEQLKANIIAKGYEKPTPIQDKAIPVLLEGQDIIATANTGTGKTAAFLIPLINNVLAKKSNRVLIITPTRELAGQIDDEFKSFAVKMQLQSALCIGGVSIDKQARALSRNPAFVIGTPGRLLDLANQRMIRFNNYNAIVLDEVDTMLDMGFINDIKVIINELPHKRHSLFFSATIPAAIKSLMNSFLQNPVSISVQTRESAANVNQDIIKIAGRNKIDVLHDLLISPGVKKSIVFLRTKHSADKLAKALIERGFKVVAIHGNKTQAQRNKALAAFKEGLVDILLATDVVARGIDIDNVTHVINFDLPQTHEDYIHRIGRTGRAGKIGQAITFID
ncbi:MAG: DEAD/DEAH box helicase [Candidatus Dependentiae bacterium]|nr:DEAD/DEAH box helicase [Candidatus Dependentiae bacterium]